MSEREQTDYERGFALGLEIGKASGITHAILWLLLDGHDLAARSLALVSDNIEEALDSARLDASEGAHDE